MTLRKKASENAVGETMLTGIFSFLSVFYSMKKEMYLLAKIDSSSANAFNLVVSKILLFGKGLTLYQMTKLQASPNWKHLQEVKFV